MDGPSLSLAEMDSDALKKSRIEQLTVKEAILMANVKTNVIILNGSMCDNNYNELYNNLEFQNWDDDNNIGPLCYMCDEEILPCEDFLICGETRYAVLWKNDVIDCGGKEEFGVLQCVFCFNYFHRKKCSLSMSDTSYLNVKNSKMWACAFCVPEFNLSKNNEKKPKISADEFLVAVFKCLYQDVKYKPSNNVMPNVIIDIEMYCVSLLRRVVLDYISNFEIG